MENNQISLKRKLLTRKSSQTEGLSLLVQMCTIILILCVENHANDSKTPNKFSYVAPYGYLVSSISLPKIQLL